MRLLIVAALALSTLAAAAQAAEKIKVGFISTLSGPLSVLGIDIRDGFNLALQQSHDTLGGLPVELSSGDDQASADVGKQLADKFLKRDKVDIMTGIVYSNVMLAVAPAVFAAKTFYVSTAAGPASLAGEQCNRYFFGLAWQNDGQSEAMGKYLTDKGVDNVYLLVPNYAGGKENAEGFKRTFRGKLAGEDYVKLGELDYSAELAEIRAAKPGAVFFFLPGGMGVNFLKQYVAAGLEKQIPLYAPGYSADEDTIAAVGEPMIGLQNSSHWAWDLDNPANQAFVAAFRKAYGRTPSMYAFQGYDAARLIDTAVSDVKGHTEDKDAFHDALRAARFKSVRGDFAFNTNQFPIQNFYLRVVEKNAAGQITNRTVSTIFKDHADPYAPSCPMK